MATVRTVDFLPDIFRTPVNKQFLSATLDQLVQQDMLDHLELPFIRGIQDQSDIKDLRERVHILLLIQLHPILWSEIDGITHQLV